MRKKEQSHNAQDVMELILQWFAEQVYQFGRFAYYVGIQTVRIFARGIRRIRRFLRPLWNLFQRSYYKTIGYRLDIEKEEWKAMRQSLLLSKKKLQYAKSCGPRYFRKVLLHSLHLGFVRYKNLFSQVGNIVLPVLSIVIALITINVVMDQKLALRMDYNGRTLGYVESEALFNEATDMASARVGSNVEFSLNSMPTYTLEFVDDVEYVTKNALCDAIINNLKTDAVKATGLYVNGEYVTATASELDMKVILQSILQDYETGQEGEIVQFADEVQVTEGYYTAASIKTPQEVEQKLTSKSKVEEYYTVVKGDTVSLVAEKFGMTSAQLKALNPTMDSKLIRIGQKLLVSAARATLPVHTVRTETYTQTVNYKVERVNTSDLYVGQSRIQVTGKNGQIQKTDQVTYQDGIEVGRENVETVTLQEAVTQRVLVGTKKRPTVHSTQASTGRYIWPVPGHRVITKYFKYYYGSPHNAIDIQAPRGTPIVAADAGVVTSAGWHYGYGNNIYIRHDDGTVTFYAHCSSLAVTTGSRVPQGMTIAYVGNTGSWSRGNHLHFGVMDANGVWRNPLGVTG